MRFKSMMRALRRGSLRWNSTTVPGEWYSDPVTGIMSQRLKEIPFLERKANNGSWIKY